MGHKYEKGCVLFSLPISNWDEIINQIDKEDLYEVDDDEFGLEKESHVTVVYGIADDYENVTKFCEENLYPIKVKTKGISKFENEFDVLKYDVESNELKEFNKLIIDAFKCDLTYSNYSPHITIAYLKKGKADKYINGDYNFPEINVQTNSGKFTFPPDNEETFTVKSKKLVEKLNEIKKYF